MLQRTVLFAAFSGKTVAVSVAVSAAGSPNISFNSSLSNATLSGKIRKVVTVHVAVKPPSTAVAVTVTVPSFSALTVQRPSLPSVSSTIFSGSALQITVLFSAFSGKTVAVSVAVSAAGFPKTKLTVSRSKVTLSAAISETVTVHVAVNQPSSVVAVTTVSPTFSALTVQLPFPLSVSSI